MKERDVVPEGVKEIIGKVPPNIVRYGNAVILAVLLLMLGMACVIPVKESIETKVLLTKKGSVYEATAIIPSYKVVQMKPGTKVQINIDSYPSSQYGFLYGKVMSVDSVLTNNGYLVKIRVPCTQASFYAKPWMIEMTGEGSILIGEHPLITDLFKIK